MDADTEQPQRDIAKLLREILAEQQTDGRGRFPVGRKLLWDAAREIERLRTQPSPREEHGWVIEGAWSDPAAPQYWAGSSLWVSNHMGAIRFAREYDARQLASAMLDGMNVRICEHVWSDMREGVSGADIRKPASFSASNTD